MLWLKRLAKSEKPSIFNQYLSMIPEALKLKTQKCCGKTVSLYCSNSKPAKTLIASQDSITVKIKLVKKLFFICICFLPFMTVKFPLTI